MSRLRIVIVLLLAASSSPAVEPEFRVTAGWPTLPEGVSLGPVSAVAVDAQDRVYVAHRGPKPILVFDRQGKFLRSWGDEHFKTAHGLRIDFDGNLWATDIGNHLVMKFDPEGKLLLSLGRKGQAGDALDQFDRPTDIAATPTGDVYITDGYGNNRVLKFDRHGKLLHHWGTRGKADGEFHLPHSIVRSADGTLFVGDRENNRVQVFDAKGKFLHVWKDSGAPYGLALARDRVYVADGRAGWVRVLDLQGRSLGRIGEKGMGAGQFQLPHMLALDSHGDLYVCEVQNKRIQKFTAAAADSWLGQKVLARQANATLTDGKAILPVRHIVYSVVAEDGDRIRVNYPGQEGWALKSNWVRLADAHAHFNGRLEANAADAFAWSRRGVAHRYAGKPNLALRDLEEAVKRAPNDSDLVGIRGMMYWANKDYDRAIADYTEAVKLDPTYAVGLRNRGLAWHAKGEHDKAIADYTESARVGPRYAPARQDRAATWLAKGDAVKAKADLEEAIEIDPRFSAAMADLARLLATSKQEAIRNGRRALEIANKANGISHGKDALVLEALAAAYAETGDFEKAVATQQKALSVLPKDAAAKAKERLARYEMKMPWRE